MTWAVGATTPFGYGVMASDICVTLGDGTQRDVLRKSYPVGRFIVAGFAGSVRIGFDMINGLRSYLAMTSEEIKDGLCWEPEFVAREFGPHATTIFEQHPRAETANGCELLLVGVQPAEHVLGNGISIVARLRAPSFEPEVAKRWGEVMSIGSGTQQGQAMEALRATVGNREMLKLELGNPGGFGRAIAFGMTRDLFFGTPPGISRHMHISIVSVNGVSFTANELTYRSPEGKLVGLTMPLVAETYDALWSLLGFDAESARGIKAARDQNRTFASHCEVLRNEYTKHDLDSLTRTSFPGARPQFAGC